MFCNFSASFEQKNEVTRLSPLVTFNITTFVTGYYLKKSLFFLFSHDLITKHCAEQAIKCSGIEVVITGLTRKRMTFLEAHRRKTLISQGFSAIIEK